MRCAEDRNDKSRNSTKETNVSEGKRPPVKVILPEEPPELTPAAAQGLLKILMKAYEKQVADKGRTEAKQEQSIPADRLSAT